MENKQTLIFIKQKNRTDDVLSIKPGIEGKIKVRYTNNKEYYYNKEDVEEYQFLEKLPVENYQFSRSGYGAYNNVISVEKYSYLEKNKIKVCFEHGKNVILNQENFKIEQSALFEKKANDVFEYLKKLANLNNIKSDDGSSLLGKNYERVTFVSQQSVLHRFLSASSTKAESESKSDNQSLIFPFGCNNSQLIATERALKNQISFIEGPPGTGKTQTILNILSNIIYRNQTALVVSNNNSAIANIKEKLSQPEIALDFLTATLGSKKNKEKFLKNQSSHYPNYLPDILENKERNLKFELVKKAFSLKEEIANIKSQISFIEIEYQHFQDYMSDKDLFEVDLSKLSSKVLLDLLLECEKIFEQNRKIGFIFKIKSIFKYGITNWSFYKQDISKIIITFQVMYYHTRQAELIKEITDIEKYLNNSDENLLDNLSSHSIILLKDKLARKYELNGSRKTFNIDDLWKKTTEFLVEYPVILSTTFSSKNSLNQNVVYDYLIMDEASQVDIATGALALSCAKNVVIVGDTKQLPNVVTNDIKAKAKVIFDSFNLNEGYQYTKSFLQSILDVMPNVTQTLLREHYRCHPKIINFCNQKFYHGDLIIMTTDKGEKDVLSVVKTAVGNHERDHYSQRQIDVIKQEIISQYTLNPEETGIITPYKNQVEALKEEISNIDTATVHKFQGKEKENIIISTVDDEISDFIDDPYLINVAISRAKKKLILVTTGNEQTKERNITDLINYIKHNNFEVRDSKIYSIFDYLYKQYNKERAIYLKKHKKVSEYDSENLMYSLIDEIISDDKYSSLDFICHFPLNRLIKLNESIKESKLLTMQEQQYIKNPATHLDFLIYNRFSKKPLLAIEVDGYKYHKKNSRQASRDSLKDHILELYEIPLLRFKTNGSGEKEKIIKLLEKLRM